MSEISQAQIELTGKPDDKDPHRKKQQKAKGNEKGERRVCPKCGYVPKKFAIQCPKCRTSLIPRSGESKADMARRYLKLLEKKR